MLNLFPAKYHHDEGMVAKNLVCVKILCSIQARASALKLFSGKRELGMNIAG
jgi:hypothetical protein